MLEVHYRPLLIWCVVPVCPLHVTLQGAVILLAPGEGVERGDLLPRFVVGERERIGVLVLKEALQVSLGQLGGVLHGEGVKALLLFLHVALPERELQEADFGATVGVAGTQKAHGGGNNDDTPAQDLQTYRNDFRVLVLCILAPCHTGMAYWDRTKPLLMSLVTLVLFPFNYICEFAKSEGEINSLYSELKCSSPSDLYYIISVLTDSNRLIITNLICMHKMQLEVFHIKSSVNMSSLFIIIHHSLSSGQ